MSRYHSYINNALFVLRKYEGSEPFALFSKKFFAANKKFGSKDRKWISQLCYQYFRVSHLFERLDENSLLAAAFLCSDAATHLIGELQPDWLASIGLSPSEKRKMLGVDPSLNLFPWILHLSPLVETDFFQDSFYSQPSLFLRTRPGEKEKVIAALNSHSIGFKSIGEDCLRLENTTDIKEVLVVNKQVVVQDLSSQRVSRLLDSVRKEWIKKKKTYKLWDCCAASGGKSILLKDSLPDFELTVSDVRQGILNNLAIRFKEAGISSYHAVLADLTLTPVRNFQNKFDLIFADVPCSGSGTWGRNPENLWSFKEENIKVYASLQRKIIDNVLPSLKSGGFLLYCTCSVFKEENEEMVAYLVQQRGLKLVESELFKGYNEKADSLFSALFISES